MHMIKICVYEREQAGEEQLELLMIFLTNQLVKKLVKVRLNEVQLLIAVELGHFSVSGHVRVCTVWVSDLVPDLSF